MIVKQKTLLLKELLAVKETVDAGQIQRAADKNGFRQTNFSKLIKELEKRFETTLFQRSPTGLIPTDIGRLLYADIKKISDDLENLETKYMKTHEMSGHLTVWTEEGLANIYLLNKLFRYYSRYPKMTLHILTEKKVDINKIDIGVIDQYLQKEPSKSKVFFKADSQSHFYTCSRYIQKYGMPQDLDDLLKNHKLFFQQSYIDRMECHSLCHNSKNLNIITDSVAVLAHLLFKGVGVTLMPDWIVKTYPNLIRVETVDFSIPHEYIVFSSLNDRNEKILSFIDFLKEISIQDKMKLI